MGKWTGGSANRSWHRERRTVDDGRIGLVEDVRQILDRWRAGHGWEPGARWNPYTASYEAVRRER